MYVAPGWVCCAFTTIDMVFFNLLVCPKWPLTPVNGSLYEIRSSKKSSCSYQDNSDVHISKTFYNICHICSDIRLAIPCSLEGYLDMTVTVSNSVSFAICVFPCRVKLSDVRLRRCTITVSIWQLTTAHATDAECLSDSFELSSRSHFPP